MKSLVACQVLLAAGLLAGCASSKKTPTTAPVLAVDEASQKITVSLHGPDNGAAVPVLIHLDIYQFDVPFGSISSNEEFWRRVDELRIGDGIATQDLLRKNGLRSGIASKGDWAYFRKFLNRFPDRTRKTTVTKNRVDLMQLDLDKPAATEDIWVFDMANHQEGRTYEDCTNTMNLAFAPLPAMPGRTHIGLCPVVACHRHRMQFTPMNQEYESPFEDVFRFYGMNLIADVGSEEFMIVSPGPQVTRSDSLGARFLVNNDKVEKLEQVLVIVPTLLQMDGKPITITDTSIGH